MTGSSVIAGVFVGGAGKRMGGRAKGLLEAPGGGTLVSRWLRVFDAVGISRVVLVGRREPYASLGLAAIDDEPEGVGPIGGLAALLGRAAGARADALAVACDMPFVSEALVVRLLQAPPAPAVAPRRDGRWEPFCARYDAGSVLPIVRRSIAGGRLSLQRILCESGATELELRPEQAAELRDWDTPQDVAQG